ncbi:hypothetical protein AMAG_03576 [Allomyces macrogynus ATCC 38327]|uniref:Uncharacterized protein n=1 Tax=Allomyces macrogynus (strain ATCC 38327) TaxID=578462 RepID=A0A0L0S9X8_ALLM3|nr:hypothetical protein AMAG_03576 [Allomyces macrogynus ATCC 38327]|eukprot:KNE59266.1 hypothetical protein AMAG_03576 [Allomyces macrogynus ATCC 38327]
MTSSSKRPHMASADVAAAAVPAPVWATPTAAPTAGIDTHHLLPFAPTQPQQQSLQKLQLLTPSPAAGGVATALAPRPSPMQYPLSPHSAESGSLSPQPIDGMRNAAFLAASKRALPPTPTRPVAAVSTTSVPPTPPFYDPKLAGYATVMASSILATSAAEATAPTTFAVSMATPSTTLNMASMSNMAPLTTARTAPPTAPARAPTTTTTSTKRKAEDSLDTLFDWAKKPCVAPVYDADVMATLDNVAPQVLSSNFEAAAVVAHQYSDLPAILAYLAALESTIAADPALAAQLGTAAAVDPVAGLATDPTVALLPMTGLDASAAYLPTVGIDVSAAYLPTTTTAIDPTAAYLPTTTALDPTALDTSAAYLPTAPVLDTSLLPLAGPAPALPVASTTVVQSASMLAPTAIDPTALLMDTVLAPSPVAAPTSSSQQVLDDAMVAHLLQEQERQAALAYQDDQQRRVLAEQLRRQQKLLEQQQRALALAAYQQQLQQFQYEQQLQAMRHQQAVQQQQAAAAARSSDGRRVCNEPCRRQGPARARPRAAQPAGAWGRVEQFFAAQVGRERAPQREEGPPTQATACGTGADAHAAGAAAPTTHDLAAAVGNDLVDGAAVVPAVRIRFVCSVRGHVARQHPTNRLRRRQRQRSPGQAARAARDSGHGFCAGPRSDRPSRRRGRAVRRADGAAGLARCCRQYSPAAAAAAAPSSGPRRGCAVCRTARAAWRGTGQQAAGPAATRHGLDDRGGDGEQGHGPQDCTPRGRAAAEDRARVGGRGGARGRGRVQCRQGVSGRALHDVSFHPS